MELKIRNDVDRVFAKYKLEMLCTTRQNLFLKVEEIAAKRMIYDELRAMDEEEALTLDEKKIICFDEEIIDAVYAALYETRRIYEVTPKDIREMIHVHLKEQ